MFFRRFKRHPIDDEALSAYVDGQLKPNERERLEAHLETCSACQESAVELRALASSLRALPQVEVPRSFALREADLAPAAARQPAAPSLRAPALLGGLASIALVAFVSLVGIDVLDQQAGRGGSADLAMSMEGDNMDGDVIAQTGLPPSLSEEALRNGYGAATPDLQDRSSADGAAEINTTTLDQEDADDLAGSNEDASGTAAPAAVEDEPANDRRAALRAGEVAAAAVLLLALGSLVLVWRRREA